MLKTTSKRLIPPVGGTYLRRDQLALAPKPCPALDECRSAGDVSIIVRTFFILFILALLPVVADAADPETTCRAKVAGVLPNVRNLVIENEMVTPIRDRPADPNARYFLVDVDFKAGELTGHQRYICLADNRGNAFLRGVARP
ncbi:MAG: hypothetical protein ACTHNN_00900 [Xanthobacteraceae bacterium]